MMWRTGGHSITSGRQPSPALQKFLRRYFVWGFGIRALICASLAWGGHAFAAGMFGVSTAAFAIGLPLLRVKRWNWLILILGAEWTHLSSGLTAAYGWGGGFHFHLLLLTVVTLIFDHIPIRLRVLMALFPMAFFLGWFPPLMTRPPVIQLSAVQANWLYVINALVFIAAAMVLVLHFIQSALVQKARAEALAESRAELIANLSHELKTPLAAMLTTAQSTLKRAQAEADYREAILLWERNTREMSHLVVRMLDLVSADVHELKPQVRKVDLVGLLGEVLLSFQDVARAKGARIEMDATGALPASTDPELLKIVLNNLLSNALRYCKEGGAVRIEVRTEPGDCRISVIDDGPGIAPKDLPHIFDAFYRADRARSRSEGAKGLGLAIAQRFAEALGAKISVQSEPGKGATFTLHCHR
ncbi:MAG TPA: hypothetical protein DIT64_20745 [Verrucomicrobiales bacterium]|nr:hypothetical protein [Verrucomicrobiales bacterium]HCN77323.1 hypothetical protein [Verrucomicrobiales bacterium]HRK16293.1 HAMP domain-containing sensor histidine kinase [Prosthecobacter sp.]